MEELEAGAHIVAVLGLPAVEGGDLRLGSSTVIEIGIGLGKDEALQPPAVRADGGVDPVLLEHPAALQKLLRGIGSLQIVLTEQIHVEEQAVGHHLLGDGHQPAVHCVGGEDDIPQVFDAVQPGQVGQLTLRPQGQDGVRVQQIQVVHIVSGPVQGHVVIGFILIVLRRIGPVGHGNAQRFLRHGYGEIRRRPG